MSLLQMLAVLYCLWLQFRPNHWSMTLWRASMAVHDSMRAAAAPFLRPEETIQGKHSGLGAGVFLNRDPVRCCRGFRAAAGVVAGQGLSCGHGWPGSPGRRAGGAV